MVWVNWASGSEFFLKKFGDMLDFLKLVLCDIDIEAEEDEKQKHDEPQEDRDDHVPAQCPFRKVELVDERESQIGSRDADDKEDDFEEIGFGHWISPSLKII